MRVIFLDLTLLKTVESVVETQSFSETARRFGITGPAVRAQIKIVESFFDHLIPKNEK